MVRSTLASLQQLGDELLKQPVQKANNVTLLLAAAKSTFSQVCPGLACPQGLQSVNLCTAEQALSGQQETLAAIQQLQLFFLASLERGELVVSSQVRLHAHPTPTASNHPEQPLSSMESNQFTTLMEEQGTGKLVSTMAEMLTVQLHVAAVVLKQPSMLHVQTKSPG